MNTRSKALFTTNGIGTLRDRLRREKRDVRKKKKKTKDLDLRVDEKCTDHYVSQKYSSIDHHDSIRIRFVSPGIQVADLREYLIGQENVDEVLMMDDC